MVMWRLKSCPRCNGDIFINKEADGRYEHCLLCGYVRDVTRYFTTDKATIPPDDEDSRKNSPDGSRRTVSSQL